MIAPPTKSWLKWLMVAWTTLLNALAILRLWWVHGTSIGMYAFHKHNIDRLPPPLGMLIVFTSSIKYAAICPRGMPQRMGSVYHHWSGSCWSGNIHQTFSVGHRESLEGNSLWRLGILWTLSLAMHLPLYYISSHLLLCIICMSVGWKSRDSVPMLVDKFMKGQLKVAEFVTHTFPLAEINIAFDVMHQGKRCSCLAVLYLHVWDRVGPATTIVVNKYWYFGWLYRSTNISPHVNVIH